MAHPLSLPWCFVNRVGPATLGRWIFAGRYRLVRARLLHPKQRPAKGSLNDLVVVGRRELNATISSSSAPVTVFAPPSLPRPPTGRLFTNRRPAPRFPFGFFLYYPRPIHNSHACPTNPPRAPYACRPPALGDPSLFLPHPYKSYSSGGSLSPCPTMTAENSGSTTRLCVQRKAAEGTRVTLGIANHDHGSEIDPRPPPPPPSSPCVKDGKRMGTPSPPPVPLLPPQGPSFAGWSLDGPAGVARRHPVLCAFAFSLLFFMGVEYTIPMVPSTSPPLDLGFIATKPLNRALATAPALNTLLAALNTGNPRLLHPAPVASGTLLILLLGRFPPSAFSVSPGPAYAGFRPLVQGFQGSGVDFPVGNVSFFLFFSGHVAGAVIASLDMRRTRRRRMARVFDALNLLQTVRLLASRGHYTIDLAVGVGAGYVFDNLAGKYEESKLKRGGEHPRPCFSCRCSCEGR
ncbi:hypothetical protein B296_00046957 [Ensete ventricosum]|uniref:AtPDCT1/2 transmembrane domain-containing protein n=1 Tax=Ensete ventricosum TaxID=4639 RepID=A0A426Y1Z3_ENSVE|nr:hypothetical protein B296_00046957 [Ensete ventricosum]